MRGREEQESKKKEDIVPLYTDTRTRSLLSGYLTTERVYQTSLRFYFSPELAHL